MSATVVIRANGSTRTLVVNAGATIAAPTPAPLVDTLQFSGGDGTQGTMSWNATEETVDLIQNDAVLQIGQEIQIHCRNTSGSLIPNGTAVMATGTQGATGRITIAPMVADGSVQPRYFLGVTTSDIANNGVGKVTTFGKVRDLNTSAFSEGAVLWCDPATPGGFTSTEPEAPNLKIATAFVVYSAVGNGVLMVRANTGIDLHDNHRVQVSGLAEGDYLTWKPANNRWENHHLTVPTGTPATASSAGTAGEIAYDANYVYICVATNTWKRASLATW